MSTSSGIVEWVKAARAGEQTAWNVLYRQYYPLVYSIALAICGNTSKAEDAVQDSFMTAFLKLSQLNDAKAFGGWLKKITIHHCTRLQRRDRLILSPDPPFPEKTDGYGEDECRSRHNQLEMNSRLYASLSDLPETLAGTVLLRYFSPYSSYGEIARIQSVPIGTVRSRLNQAKLKLSEKWNQHWETGIQMLKECEEWNDFYFASFSGMHHEDVCKNKFVRHLQKDIRIIFTSGKTVEGPLVIESMLREDRVFGSWFKPVGIHSFGNISIVNARHINSAEYPDRCPESMVCVMHRQNGKAVKMHLYSSAL